MNSTSKQVAPPGFIVVPSRSRPGEFSYWSQVLGQRFGSLELAWAAFSKLNAGPTEKLDPVRGLPSAGAPKVIPSSGPVQTVDPADMFVDRDFPPTAGSIGKTIVEDRTSRLRISIKDRDTAKWLRLPEFIRKVNNMSPDAPVELFGDIEPNDLTQGIVGDCWLLATMACFAEFPNAIESLFVDISQGYLGKYSIRLFNLDSRSWETVTIDDYIPCKTEDDYSNVPSRIRPEDGVRVYDGRVPPVQRLKPMFAVPNGNQMWAALLEKAMAKFVGSYAGIAGGHEPFAMIAFTGFPQVYQFKRVPMNESKTVAELDRWERGWAQWAGKFSPSCGYRPILDEDGRYMDNELLFKRLVEYDRMNYVLAASIVCFEPPKTAEGYIRKDGLVVGHAYSLLSVEHFPEKQIRLVKLRNPHGKGTKSCPTEWNGAWADDSVLWTQNPDIARALAHQPANDGIFWMSFSDFVKSFDKVLVLPFPMSEPRGALSSMRRAKLLVSMTTAARKGKALAGMALQNLTHIDQVVNALHLMSVRPYDPYLNATDWVADDPELYEKWAHEKLGTDTTLIEDEKP